MNQWLAHVNWLEVAGGCLATLSMLGVALGCTVLLGLPLGVLLYLTGQRPLLQSPRLHRLMSVAANVLRSMPFIILLIVLIPVTAVVAGTTLGVRGAIPPLVIGCTPFFARLVESALREVDRGLIEAVQSMGATTPQIILHTLLPEARPGLIAAVTVTAIVLVDYTAMAGVVGGGGLGDLAIRFGYQRFQTDVMVVTVLLLILLVQALQVSGDRLVRHYTRR